jgi:hypothetical protein
VIIGEPAQPEATHARTAHKLRVAREIMIIPLQSMRWYESAIRFVPLFIGRTDGRMRTIRRKGRSRLAGAIERTCTIGKIGIDYRAAAARLGPSSAA